MDRNGLVSVKRCESYDTDLLHKAVEEHFERLGVAELLPPDACVLLKPNLLTGRDPAEAITTHPAVVQAVADWLHRQGVRRIVLADSPGGPFTAARMKSIYKASCMDTVTGVELNYDVTWGTRFREEGAVCKSFNLLTPVLEADFIINLAKLKTHGMTTMSGGIKNLFGTIPGLQKPEMHYLYPDKADFSGMLVDLSQTVAPAVTVIDAIDAMEGEGPSSGTVRRMGYLFAACNHYAQDWVAAQAIGLNPLSVDMVRIARDRGLFDPDTITVLGDAPAGVAPFALPRSTSLLFADRLPRPLLFLQKPAIALVKRVLRPLPKVNRKKCIGCGKCAESCPPHTIDIQDRKAVIDHKKCISCFCCHEMCPVKAIDVKRSLKL